MDSNALVFNGAWDVGSMSDRKLRYVVVESGLCQNCYRDAGDHSLEGLCTIGSAAAGGLSFRGCESYAFIDVNSAEVKAWMSLR